MLFNDTIKYNIAYGNLDATDVEIEEAARLAQIHDVIMDRFPEGTVLSNCNFEWQVFTHKVEILCNGGYNHASSFIPKCFFFSFSPLGWEGDIRL